MTDDVIARAKALYEQDALIKSRCNGLAYAAWEGLSEKEARYWIKTASKGDQTIATEAEAREWLEKARDSDEAPPTSPTSAADILNQARSIVSGERQTTNGAPERSLEMLAAMWSAFLGVEVTATDAGLMLAQLKMVRAKTGVTKDDHFVDGTGYFALAGEVAARANNGTP